uniref:Uncharacterized protein n=1 Tax=Arundo donax TaxID=35708 RepID=A0A0A9CRM3_ARUDO
MIRTKYEVVCRPKNYVGLGVLNTRTMNEALCLK